MKSNGFYFLLTFSHAAVKSHQSVKELQQAKTGKVSGTILSESCRLVEGSRNGPGISPLSFRAEPGTPCQPYLEVSRTDGGRYTVTHCRMWLRGCRLAAIRVVPQRDFQAFVSKNNRRQGPFHFPGVIWTSIPVICAMCPQSLLWPNKETEGRMYHEYSKTQ